jgi:hypothetical protein
MLDVGKLAIAKDDWNGMEVNYYVDPLLHIMSWGFFVILT